jgi:uncharacterized protein (TIGR02453 family)
MQFSGFPRESVQFFASLRENNNKVWFDSHRKEYDTYVLEPARSFVVALGERLRDSAPGIQADPRTNRSIFRIHRDTRFSNDKSPYKTHLALFFWEGSGPRMENPGFYFHFDDETLILGEGIYRFPGDMLGTYRESVVHPEQGKQLEEALEDIRKKGRYTMGVGKYKRVPRGYDRAHPRAELLLYDGLHAGESVPIPEYLFSTSLIDRCCSVFSDLLPLHRWLVELVKRNTSAA